MMLALALPGRYAVIRKSTISWFAVFLVGCSSSAEPEVDTAAIALQAHKRCITAALDNTIYKDQSDTDLERALASQNLDGCPIDFVKAYVRFRNAAYDQREVGRELQSHQGLQNDAQKRNLWNLGCSILAGQQCAAWPSDVWASENTQLKDRLTQTQHALTEAKHDVELIIAQYGIYIQAAPEASQDAWSVLSNMS